MDPHSPTRFENASHGQASHSANYANLSQEAAAWPIRPSEALLTALGRTS